MFEAHNSPTSAIAFSLDSQLLASASFNDKTVNISDPARGMNRQTFVGYTEGITPVAFSLDGKLLASASLDNTVNLWDPTTGRVKGGLITRSSDTPIVFSPDGNLLACAVDALTPSSRLADKGEVDL